MKRYGYSMINRAFSPLDQGDYVLHSDAMKEIEANNERINILLTEREGYIKTHRTMEASLMKDIAVKKADLAAAREEIAKLTTFEKRLREAYEKIKPLLLGAAAGFEALLDGTNTHDSKITWLIKELRQAALKETDT